MSVSFQGSTAHFDLGLRFFQPVPAPQFPKHILRFRNDDYADLMGLGHLDDAAWLEHFGQFKPLEGSFPSPIALAYHGHQFRHYNPDLGDGRGFLFAQARGPKDGRLMDFGTKGSGQTPWSRGGDGRLTLKGGVREILATEQLAALGVHTSKTFSIIETGEALTRGDEPSPTRSAVMVRLSHSHIRIGSFQRPAYAKDLSAIEALTRHTVKHYFPDLDSNSPMAELSVEFVRSVAQNTAKTTAQWIAAGFVHGVLNTDNINVTGESFDYGPWRFLPTMDPEFTAAYFDETGLYAFGRQGEAVLWNVSRLGECFSAFAGTDDLAAAVSAFNDTFTHELNTALCRRLGIREEDGRRLNLNHQLFPALTQAQAQVPFEQFFYDLYGGKRAVHKNRAMQTYTDGPLSKIVQAISDCEAAPSITPEHAYFTNDAPCTMLVDEVEYIWDGIAEEDNWSRLDTKLAAIQLMRGGYASGGDGP